MSTTLQFIDHLPSNLPVASFITEKILNEQWRELLLFTETIWDNLIGPSQCKMLIVGNVSSRHLLNFNVYCSMILWSSVKSLPTYIIEIFKVDTIHHQWFICSWMENTIQSMSCYLNIYMNLFTWLMVIMNIMCGKYKEICTHKYLIEHSVNE